MNNRAPCIDQNRCDFDEIGTPIGAVLIVVVAEHLVALDFADCAARMHRLLAQRLGDVTLRSHRDPAGLSRQVRAYFAGDLNALQATPIALHGTPFQERAWQALRRIQPGATSSYARQAAGLGAPRSARAVGRANALNPIAIAVPCHRLVGADGSLTGYAGGLARKRWLLRHEGVALEAL